MLLRLVLVLVLAAVVAVVALRSRRPADAHRADGHRVPAELLGDGDRTWIVFSTPYCATCGPVEAQLRQRFPTDDVRRADVEAFASTAAELGVRRAPTVVRVDQLGVVDLLLAGPEAVREHLGVSALV